MHVRASSSQCLCRNHCLPPPNPVSAPRFLAELTLETIKHLSWTYQPSQPRSPAPPCWIWSGCTWTGMASSAPLSPAGAGSLWLGQCVRSLQWTRRGEPSPIPYSQDSPQWCWLYSPQWLACTQSHPGKGKSRTLTWQAELRPQCCSVPLTLQLLLSIQKKQAFAHKEKRKGGLDNLTGSSQSPRPIKTHHLNISSDRFLMYQL